MTQVIALVTPFSESCDKFAAKLREARYYYSHNFGSEEHDYHVILGKYLKARFNHSREYFYALMEALTDIDDMERIGDVYTLEDLTLVGCLCLMEDESKFLGELERQL